MTDSTKAEPLPPFELLELHGTRWLRHDYAARLQDEAVRAAVKKAEANLLLEWQARAFVAKVPLSEIFAEQQTKAEKGLEPVAWAIIDHKDGQPYYFTPSAEGAQRVAKAWDDQAVALYAHPPTREWDAAEVADLIEALWRGDEGADADAARLIGRLTGVTTEHLPPQGLKR